MGTGQLNTHTYVVRPHLTYLNAHFLSRFAKLATSQSQTVTQLCIFNCQCPASFQFILVLFQQTNNSIFITNKCYKMSIQLLVLGFKPTTFEYGSSPVTTRPGAFYVFYGETHSKLCITISFSTQVQTNVLVMIYHNTKGCRSIMQYLPLKG